MSTTVQAAPSRDYAQETRDTLQNQINLAPQLYQSEAQYQPLYNQLQLQMAQNATFGTPEQMGLLDQYAMAAPQLGRIQAQGNTQQRSADIADVQNLAPAARAAFLAANPDLVSAMNTATGMGGNSTNMANAQLNAALRQAPTSNNLYAQQIYSPTVSSQQIGADQIQNAGQLGVGAVQANQIQNAGQLGIGAVQANQIQGAGQLGMNSVRADRIQNAPQIFSRDVNAQGFAGPNVQRVGDIAGQGYNAALVSAPGQVDSQDIYGGQLGNSLYNQALNAGPSRISSTLESAVLNNLTADGGLSAAEQRQAEQQVRASYAARGMAMSPQAISAEVQNRLVNARQRQMENLQIAQSVNNQLQAEQQANRGFAGNIQQSEMARLQNNQNNRMAAQQFNVQTGMQAQGVNQSALNQAQQYSQEAALRAAQANQQAGLNVNTLQAQLGLEANKLQTSTNLQAQLANQAAAMQAGQFNVSTANQIAQQNQEAALRARLANQQMAAQTGQFNVSTANQIAQQNQDAALRASLANQQMAAQTGQFNIGTANQVAQQNQDAALRASLANQNAYMQTGQFNVSTANQIAQINQEAALRASLANQSAGLQAETANAQFGYQSQLANQQANIASDQANRAYDAQQTQNYYQNLGQAGQLTNQTTAADRQYAAQLVGLQQATMSDPYQAILGRSSQNYNQNAGLAAQGAGINQMAGPALFNPESSYANNIYGGNQQATNAANIAQAQANASMIGGIAGGLGAIAAAPLTGGGSVFQKMSGMKGL